MVDVLESGRGNVSLDLYRQCLNSSGVNPSADPFVAFK